MDYSEPLVEFIQGWEKYSLEPHLDTVATRNRGYEVWDIGYGHVIQPGEDRRSITYDECVALLRWDLWQVDSGCDRLIKVPLMQNQWDALLSFAYNCGLDIDDDNIAEGLGDSALLRYVNACNFTAAANEFPKWNKSRREVVLG